jgi:membrane associated rhomboid family serine protease
MLPLYDTARQRRAPVMTALIVGANLAVFGWEMWLLLGGGGRTLELFLEVHALVPRRLLAHYDDGGQWLTLLTHMFLHGGLAHVAGNLWFLWIFGGNVEDRLGPFRFLLFYLLAGLAAAALQIAVEPSSPLPMLGASGAISGVLGAYLVLFPTAWIVALIPWVVPIMPVPAVLFLVLWFVLQAYNGVGALLIGAGAAGGVARWAHAGGFVAGVCLMLWAKSAGWVRRR